MESVAVETLGFEGLIGSEWLAANGLGGYASSTICGMNTRKYHGLLVAAMAPPVRRMVILSRVDERVITPTGAIDLSCNEYPETIFPRGDRLLRAFSPEPFPRWAYQSDGYTLTKTLRLLPGENTVCLSYTLLTGSGAVTLDLRPLLALRPIHELMYQWNGRLRADAGEVGKVRIGATSRTPEVLFSHDGEFVDSPVWYLNTIYRREQERGYAGLEDLWMPGVIRGKLSPGQSLHLVCSMEKVDLDRVVSLVSRPPEIAVEGKGAGPDRELIELKTAARVYVVNIPSETKPGVSIITHYPWSSPSVRGAMIALSGLLLVPGRFDEARLLLESTAALVDGGLIPSELPEDGGQPVYHGADVALWFINAVGQYWNYTGDEAAVRKLLPVCEQIIGSYRRGTGLGIMADSEGLIVSRSPGIATTWMDAKLIDSVITPREGRAVEINALWHNALRTIADLQGRVGNAERSRELGGMADVVQRSFNMKFWNGELNCLYDVVDDRSIDSSVRPNQLFAVSLPHPVVWRERQEAVLNVVMNELVTPLGVRTLSPRDTAYQGRYRGNVITRDRAYHNGSAYPWLLGPLVSALMRTRGRGERTILQARGLLEKVLRHMRTDGLGLVCELFDGDVPQRPGGAPASAPAAGELLRAWSEDICGNVPARRKGTSAAPGAGGSELKLGAVESSSD